MGHCFGIPNTLKKEQESPAYFAMRMRLEETCGTGSSPVIHKHLLRHPGEHRTTVHAEGRGSLQPARVLPPGERWLGFSSRLWLTPLLPPASATNEVRLDRTTHNPVRKPQRCIVMSREATVAHSCGRQPAEKERKEHPAAKRRQQSHRLAPLRGSDVCIRPAPWARAHGYVLPPLRG